MTPTILCVDDEDAVTGMLRDTLEPSGYRVLTAASVREALEIVRATKLDLIILDIFLPDVDGLSFLELLRLDPKARKTPVIMLTGCGSTDARRLAVQRGACAFLQKPFQLQQLFSLVSWAAPAPHRASSTAPS